MGQAYYRPKLSTDFSIIKELLPNQLDRLKLILVGLNTSVNKVSTLLIQRALRTELQGREFKWSRANKW